MKGPDGYLGAATLKQLEEEVPTLADLTARAARLWPDAPGLHFDETGETLSFAEIEARSNKVAHALIALGIEPGERVALMLRNRWEFPVCALGITKAGAAMVPMNVGYRTVDADYILGHSEARAVIAADEFLPLLTALSDEDHGHRHLISADGGAEPSLATLLKDVPDTPPGVALTPETWTNIQYTSGTTGHPKGCIIPHGYWLGMARKILNDLCPLGPGDTMLTAQPFYYIDPQWNVMTALLSGARLVVLDGFHPSTLWRRIRDYEATFFYCLGAMPTLLLKMPPDPDDRKHNLKVVTASAIPPSQHAALEERFGIPWLETFGMTETGADICVRMADHDALVGTGCLGTPMTYREADVFGEDDAPLPPGEVGELVLRGPWMMEGYFKNPEATAEIFRGGWLHTGDLARKDEAGRFYYVGRKKEMIRRAGENIAAVEVEEVIANHPAVQSAACIPVPDEIREEEVKAYVVLQPGQTKETATPGMLSEWCADRLAAFKVPRYWAYIDALPRTPSERVAKGKLVEAQEDLRTDAYDRVDGVWR